MDSVETEIVDTLVSLDKANTPKADMDRYRKNAVKRYRVPADRVTVIKLAFNDRRPDKAHRMKVECAGNDPWNREAEARKKRVEKSLARDERVKAPGSVFAPIDLTGSAKERYEKLRRLDVEDAARKARGPLKQDDDDVEEDDNAEGSATNPVDLTTAKNTERFSFGRASRVKARRTIVKTKGPRSKRSR